MATLIPSTLVLFAALGTAGCATTKSDDATPGRPRESSYVRNIPTNRTVIVFIHGLFGDAKSSWTNPSTRAYWPRLLLQDQTFDLANIYVYAYTSPLFRKTYSLDELAENLRLQLSNDRVFGNHEEVLFLAHSQGGLVVRSFLLKYRESAKKVALSYFFATPTTGAAIANVARLVSQNPQLGQLTRMRLERESLAALRRSWLAAQLPILSYCAYEVRPTFGFMVVEQESAESLCNMPLDPIDADHLNIVKPFNDRDVSYIAFRAAFASSRTVAHSLTTSEASPSEANRRRAIREALAAFVDEGQQLWATCLDAEPAALTREAKAWAVRIETYLLGQLDRSYISRFRAGAATHFPKIPQSFSDEQSALCGFLYGRVVRLDDFIKDHR